MAIEAKLPRGLMRLTNRANHRRYYSIETRCYSIEQWCCTRETKRAQSHAFDPTLRIAPAARSQVQTGRSPSGNLVLTCAALRFSPGMGRVGEPAGDGGCVPEPTGSNALRALVCACKIMPLRSSTSSCKELFNSAICAICSLLHAT